jgi:hypothetical protein
LNLRRVVHSNEIEIEVLSEMRAREIIGDVSGLARSRGPVAAGGPDMATGPLTKATRLASEQVGRDLFLRVHRVVFTERSGRTVEAITLNTVSSDECSIERCRRVRHSAPFRGNEPTRSGSKKRTAHS